MHVECRDAVQTGNEDLDVARKSRDELFMTS